MIDFQIDTSQLTRLAQLIPDMAKIVDQEIDRAMDESGALLTPLVAARVPVNYGIARASIGFTTKGHSRGELTGRVASDGRQAAGISTAEYINYLEFGTRAHWPPLAPLKLWALRKFKDERIGYMVAAKIAREGTWAKGMFALAWYKTGERKVTRIFTQVPAKCVKRYEAEIQPQIDAARRTS